MQATNLHSKQGQEFGFVKFSSQGCRDYMRIDAEGDELINACQVCFGLSKALCLDRMTVMEAAESAAG